MINLATNVPVPPMEAKRSSRRPRARTIAAKRMRAAVRAHATEHAMAAEVVTQRPQTRGECVNGLRPCPWVSCRHHLYLDINPDNGSIKLNFPNLEPWQLQHSCTLDVAAAGEHVLEDIGEAMNLTRERIRQIETSGLISFAARADGTR